MNQQKINYIVMAGLCILALILGFFGITLPVTPEIPSPLPTPTPVDLSGVVQREELALVQSQVDALDAQALMGGGESVSFGVYQVPCHMEQGGEQWTATDGCTWEIQSGATLDVQSGATLNLGGYVTSTLTGLTVNGNSIITGNLVVSGATNLVGNVSSSAGGVSITDALIVGVDGTSYNVTFFSDTAGDYFLWDQANEALTIIGTNTQDALNVDDGNVDIEDNLDVNGTAYLDELTVDAASDFNAAMNVDANGDFDSLSTLAIDSDAYYDSTGSVQINDNAVVTGTLTVAGLLYPGFANATITDGYLLTATVTAYALDSGGAVTMTLQAVGVEGQLLILMGDDANTITIADTNIRSTDGNAITVGQYDTVAFVYQDNEWLELLKSANQ